MKLVILQAASSGINMPQIIMIGGMALVFYFLIFRPNQKKQKDAKALQEGIKTGDKIVTAGGFHGKVITVEDTLAVVELSKGNTVKIEKSSITTVVA